MMPAQSVLPFWVSAPETLPLAVCTHSAPIRPKTSPWKTAAKIEVRTSKSLLIPLVPSVATRCQSRESVWGTRGPEFKSRRPINTKAGNRGFLGGTAGESWPRPSDSGYTNVLRRFRLRRRPRLILILGGSLTAALALLRIGLGALGG
jgi:hypothetical protein